MPTLPSRSAIATAPNDTEFYIIIPNASTGGYDEYRITKSDFLKELQAEVDALDVEPIQTINSGDQGAAPDYDVTRTHTRGVQYPVVQVTDENDKIIVVETIFTGVNAFTLRYRSVISGNHNITIR